MSLPSLLLQFFAEFIFRLVKDKFTELAGSRLSAPNSRPKVLAGIVMTRGEKHQQILPCESKKTPNKTGMKVSRLDQNKLPHMALQIWRGDSHLQLSVNL